LLSNKPTKQKKNVVGGRSSFAETGAKNPVEPSPCKKDRQRGENGWGTEKSGVRLALGGNWNRCVQWRHGVGKYSIFLNRRSREAPAMMPAKTGTGADQRKSGSVLVQGKQPKPRQAAR